MIQLIIGLGIGLALMWCLLIVTALRYKRKRDLLQSSQDEKKEEENAAVLGDLLRERLSAQTRLEKGLSTCNLPQMEPSVEESLLSNVKEEVTKDCQTLSGAAEKIGSDGDIRKEIAGIRDLLADMQKACQAAFDAKDTGKGQVENHV